MTPVRAGGRPEPDGTVRGPPSAGAIAVASSQAFTSRRSVTVGVFVAILQTAALAAAAVITGSAELKTQTATNLADVAVGAFLLIAVVSSDRPADSSHPLGYGRERFFWSFIAAVGIFFGGVGAAAAALRARRPTVAYVYLNPVAQHRPRRFTPAGRFSSPVHR